MTLIIQKPALLQKRNRVQKKMTLLVSETSSFKVEEKVQNKKDDKLEKNFAKPNSTLDGEKIKLQTNLDIQNDDVLKCSISDIQSSQLPTLWSGGLTMQLLCSESSQPIPFPESNPFNIDNEPVLLIKPPSPTLTPLTFTEQLEIQVQDTNGTSSCPVAAQDLFSCSLEFVVPKPSIYFRELKENKILLEKYTKCKLVTLKIPASMFTSGNCEYTGALFVLKETEDYGYKLHAYLPVIDDSLCISIGILKGPDDENLPWPFSKVVVFRLEKSNTVKDIGSPDYSIGEAEALDKGFSCDDCIVDIMDCLSRPSEENNLCVGFNFLAKENLKDYISSDGHILIYFLFLPQEAKSVPSLHMETPMKVNGTSSLSSKERNTAEQIQHLQKCEDAYKEDAVGTTEHENKSECISPRLPKCLVSLMQCEHDIAIIKLYCGIALVSFKISEIADILKSGSIDCFEKYFNVTMDTLNKLEYSMKAIVLVAEDAVSIGIAIVKSQDDHCLRWPFARTVVFHLVNEDSKKSIDIGFNCQDINANIAHCFQCPTQDSNAPVGIPEFISTAYLKNGFIINDTITIKVLVIPTQFGVRTFGVPTMLKQND